MPGENQPGTAKQTRARKLTILALSVLALGTIFLLPRFVTGPLVGNTDPGQVPVPADSPAYVSPSTAAEQTRFRRESQRVLAEIIAARERLLERQVEAWADIRFRQALRQVEEGDEQYSHGEYQASLDSYGQASSELAALEAFGRQTLEAAIGRGLEAVESLNLSIASDANELAGRIAPQDPAVQELAARVASLPEVAALLGTGDQARAAGQLEVARAAYRDAASLDPKHRRAASSLGEIRTAITEQTFRRHMSQGFAALDNNDFELARSAFEQAGTIHPGDDAVSRALAQVENRASRLSVNQAIGRAADLESREEWAQALAAYEALLEQDPTLTEVRARLVPARVRADLDARLQEVLEDPLKLSAPAVYGSARQTLADARSIANPGPRLRDQAARLERLLEAALRPVEVVFRSDNLTHVTLFRVADLGRFEQTSLRLRPGRYVAAGTRQGYRDVRIEFTITGEAQGEPIVVRCVEPI
jgi:tetratricopeptide (TPR) repeat protein